MQLLMQVAIIGTGWYGSYVCEYIHDNYPDITIIMFEKLNETFSGSSFNNQNRLHLGFHYPRSYKTRKNIINSYNKFKNKYRSIIDSIDKNIYAISIDSIIDYQTYINIFDKEGYQFSLIDNNVLNNTENNLIKIDEEYINHIKAKKYFQEKLKNVKIIYEEIKNIENKDNKVILNNLYKFDLVFNCTYNHLNLKNIKCVYEKCISLIYKLIDNSKIEFDCLTIMDGPFSSIYIYDKDKETYTLTNVKYTPLIKSCNIEDIYNYDINKININELKEKFENDILKFYSNFTSNFSYDRYVLSDKCKNINNDDSRDLNINVDDRIFSVWCGKISLVVLLDERIEKFINHYKDLSTTIH